MHTQTDDAIIEQKQQEKDPTQDQCVQKQQSVMCQVVKQSQWESFPTVQILQKTFISLALKTAISQHLQSNKQPLIFKVYTKQSIDFTLFDENLRFQEASIIQSTLSRTFVHSRFMNMKQLHLWSNSIENCEFMRFLDAPQLKSIFMSSVKVTQYKPLDKVYMPMIQIFNVDKNLSNRIYLQRTKIKKHSQSLVLEFNEDSLVIQQDLSPLFKLQPLSFDRIRIQAKQRIKQQLIRKKLMQRFVFFQKKVSLL